MDRRMTLFLVLVALISGCASVVPEALEKQVDRQVRFIDLQPDPGRFAGRMVVLGGEIVGITRSGELTELEVAELPLDAPRDRPQVYAVSRGRFVVTQIRLQVYEHHITVPRHKNLRVGTLSAILADVASYLEISRENLVQTLFGR